MNENKQSSKNDFSLASNLTPDQKRQIDINLLKDSQERARLEMMLKERRYQEKQLVEAQAEELKRMTDDYIRKSVKAAAAPPPPGSGEKKSFEERLKAARELVAEKVRPKHEEETETLLRQHNENLDREIAGAKAAQASQKLRTDFNRSRRPKP